MNMNQTLPMFLFLSVASIALFSFIAVAAWSSERRREREAYYRSETLKKIAETREAAGGNYAIEFLREEEKNAALRRREGQKLGGVITVAIGVGMMVFIKAVDRGSTEPAYLVGLIPLLIGVALLAYTYVLAPKQ